MVELSEVEDAMKRHPDPVVTTSDLADELGCSSRHVLDQLRLLQRADAVASKKVGARATAWWHTERVTGPQLPADEHPDQSALKDHEDRETARAPGTDAGRDDQPDDGLAADLAALDLPGDADQQAERRAAVRASYDLLRDRGELGRGGFLAKIYDTGRHQAGYSTGASWWNTVSDALDDLAAERDDIEPPNDGRKGDKWQWVG